ncbi:hypothetical protein E2C01_098436 [Portunus trituberculatus]|uniref:Uncharacterized protein n=1 Tax=Portunus trituberculatus TaxID=210409 RepID=A0A5B7K170_PORTR|nr:hypothetical protein [Portunus trituberculatus]
MNMRQLRTLVVCVVVLLGVAAGADDEALLPETPAADHLSEVPLSEHYHHSDLNAAEGLAGSTPSGNYNNLEEDPDTSTSTSDDYWGAEHDAYENDGDYWGSEDYDCAYYDGDYDDDYGRYASEWFSGESQEPFAAEPDVPPAHSEIHAHSRDSHANHASKEGNMREMDVN